MSTVTADWIARLEEAGCSLVTVRAKLLDADHTATPIVGLIIDALIGVVEEMQAQDAEGEVSTV